MKLSKEQQVRAVYDLKVGYTLGHADIAMLKAMASQLLVSMEQEPVAWMHRNGVSLMWAGDLDAKFEVKQGGWSPLYAAPQLPQPAVVPSAELLSAMEEVLRISDRDHEAWHRARKGIADFRAVMIQGAEPVSQHPDLTVWYGSMPETNGKSNWTAILHRKGEGIQDGITIDRSEYPDRVLYAADRVRYLIGEKPDRPYILDYDGDKHSGYVKPVSQSDELPMDYLHGHKDGLEWAARLAEANNPQTGDWLYDDPLELAKAIRKGPDMPTASVQGWIPCSERMPEEIGRYWCYVEEQNSLGKSHYQWNCSWNGDRWWVESESGGRVTHWMPLQEPPKQTPES